MTSYNSSGDTLIALPGGGQVSVAFLASQGVPGYGALADGSYVIPSDATAVGFGGTRYAVAEYPDWFPAYQPQKPKPQSQQDEFDASGAASIKNILRQYGLDELVPSVDGWVRQGLSWPEIEVMLRDPSTPAGKVFDRYYPEVRIRAEKGLKPMSVAEIQAYRQTVAQVGKSLGLPEDFYSKDYASKLIEGDVSPSEFQDRANEYATLGLQELAADPVKQQELEAFERYYAVQLKPGEIAGMIFNTDLALPTLKKRINAVQLDAAAGRVGFGDLTRSEAERLAELGVSQQQAVQGFGSLTDTGEVFAPLPGEEATQTAIGRQEQLGAAFEGDSRARKRIETRQRQRASVFAGGGGFAADKAGFGGIGVAS